jgi:predicted transcriptional regulator
MGMTADITAAHVSKNTVAVSDVPTLITSIYQALSALDTPTQAVASKPEFVPAVSRQKSLANPNFIISMIDGKPYAMLKRHLAKNGLTPDEYRERYGLQKGYPMVASNYSEKRRNLALNIGLGRKPKGK